MTWELLPGSPVESGVLATLERRLEHDAYREAFHWLPHQPGAVYTQATDVAMAYAIGDWLVHVVAPPLVGAMVAAQLAAIPPIVDREAAIAAHPAIDERAVPWHVRLAIAFLAAPDHPPVPHFRTGRESRCAAVDTCVDLIHLHAEVLQPALLADLSARLRPLYEADPMFGESLPRPYR